MKGGEPGGCAFALAAVLIALGIIGLLASLTGCAPPPPRVQVVAPAWMLTPVPTVDIGVDALHAWNCVTEPETVCTEWHEPVTN